MMKLCIYLLLVSTAAAQGGSSGNSQPSRNVDESLADALKTSDRINLPPGSTPNSETCTTPSKEPGICGPLSECPQYIPLISQLGDPDTNNFFRSRICRILKTSLHICCPVTTSVVTTLPDILPSENECGLSSADRIIGGSEVPVGAWPWLTAVGWPRLNNGFRALCGGTLITKRHVLSAAHCFLPQLPTLTHVRVGEHNLQNNDDGAVQDIKIVSYVANEYNPRSKENDIELLILEEDVKFNDFVRPACLPLNPSERDNNFEGETATVIGWGRIVDDDDAPPGSDVPMEANVPVQSLQTCSRLYHTRVLGPIVDTRNICAGEGPTDACNGDSGGPLNYLNNVTHRYYVIGIVSHGVSCGSSEFPGVYTRVGSFIDWILSNL